MSGWLLLGAGVLDTFTMFIKDDKYMLVHIFVGSVALGMIIERTISLLFRYAINGPPFVEQITKLVLTGNVDRAIKLCSAAPNASLARVVRAGLTRANRGEVEVSKALEESLLEETPKIQKRVQSLFSVANIATLLGLLGTIFGLIQAFRALQFAAPEQKQALLASGISQAMHHTAAGLSIAVTCIIAHMLLTNRAKAMIEELEAVSVKIENLLSRRAEGEAGAHTGAGAA